jgi:predicted transcriptional regulator
MRAQGITASTKYVNSSRVRLGLLFNLISGPKSPSQLATMEKRHVSHVSRALSELRAKGIVESMPRTSRETLYRLTSQGYVIYISLAHAK